MALCPNCGVELGAEATACPLCRAVVTREQSPAGQGSYPEHIIDPEDLEKLSPREKRTIVVEIFSVCTLIASFVTVMVDLFLSRRLSWSVWPALSLALVWLVVCIPLILAKHPWLVFSVLGPSILLFVFLLDILDGRLSWFLPLGMPIVLVVEAGALASAVLIAATKQKGANVLGIVIAAVAFVCVGIEVALNLNYLHRFMLSWSAVVGIACLPVSGFLFYMHYRIVKRASLRKLFHL